MLAAMRTCPRHPAVVVEAVVGGWRCFICGANVEPREVEEPSTLPFGARPNLGLYDRAIRELADALQRHPHDARLLQRLGEIHQKKNELAEAAGYFLRLASEFEADGAFLKAVATYRRVLTLQPDLVEARLRLATVYEELGLASDAVAQLEAALHTRADPALLEKVRAELERLRRR